MKITFITTVLNEAKHIQALLDSLVDQSRQPDEIIIIDAGSRDQTTSIISHFIKSTSIPTRLIVKRGFNRSQGRNLAINRAEHPLIAVSDAGCILDKDWLKRLIEPFKNHAVESVGGFYQPLTHSVFQKSLAPFVAVMPDKLDIDSFLPSSRSIAFKKSAWNKVNKYPEELDYCEDLVFASRLKQQTNLAIKIDALVHWHQAENIIQFFKQIFHYASGDVLAGYRPHLRKITTVFLRYFLFGILPPLYLLYLFWPIFKHFHRVSHPLAFIYLPLLQITADTGIILGSLYGIFKRYT